MSEKINDIEEIAVPLNEVKERKTRTVKPKEAKTMSVEDEIEMLRRQLDEILSTREKNDKETQEITARKFDDEEYMRKRGNELVEGTFIYHTKPGQVLEFTYFHEKGDPELPIKIVDQEKRTLKRKVAEHLKNSGVVQLYKTILCPKTGQYINVEDAVVHRWYFHYNDVVLV